MTAILFAGEFVFYLVLGVFNTDSLFGFSLVGEVCTNSAMSLLVNAASVSYKLQTYTVVVMLTCTVFFALNGCSFRAGYLVAGLSLLCELVVGVPYVYYLVYFIVSAIATLLTNIFLMLIITHMAKYFILIVIWWVFIEYKKSKCVLTNAKIRK